MLPQILKIELASSLFSYIDWLECPSPWSGWGLLLAFVGFWTFPQCIPLLSLGLSMMGYWPGFNNIVKLFGVVLAFKSHQGFSCKEWFCRPDEEVVSDVMVFLFFAHNLYHLWAAWAWTTSMKLMLRLWKFWKMSFQCDMDSPNLSCLIHFSAFRRA